MVKSVRPEHYLALYREILEHLDPVAIRYRLLAFGSRPVLLCYEHAIHSGAKWCHPHWIQPGCATSGTAMPSLSSSQVATVSLTCVCAASIRRGSGGADRVFPRARVGWEIKLPQSA